MTPQNIRASRLALGLTAGQAGRLFGVGPRNWRRIEAGQIEMRGPLRRLMIVAAICPDVMPALQTMAPDATKESGGGDE